MLGAFKSSRTERTPFDDHPLAAHSEPSKLEGWIPQILYCDSEGSRAFLRILSTEGRGVRLYREYSNPEGPERDDTCSA
jgi:hypothetical protein